MSKESEIREMVEGYDLDVALAILSQARNGVFPIDEIQVLHLLRIGFSAGYRKCIRSVRELHRATG